MFKCIAIDSGKYATKALLRKPDGTEKCLVFRTKMEETIRNESQGQSYIVTYNGKRYLLGEQAGASSMSAKTSKAEELHKVCTYTALHQLCNSGDEIVVAVGCPLSVYENPESRNTYKRFMFPQNQIDIKVGDITKHLNIRSVIVLPESSGVIYQEPEKYGKALIAVIDVGGLNINACAYNKGIPILNTLYTDTFGGNILTLNLRNSLITQYNTDIPAWMMDEIVTDGYVTDNMSADGVLAGSKEFIAEFKKKYVQTILKKCEANGWNLSLMMKLVFTGGTSEMLASEIKAVLPGATIYPDSSMANVRGFLKVITE